MIWEVITVRKAFLVGCKLAVEKLREEVRVYSLEVFHFTLDVAS